MSSVDPAQWVSLLYNFGPFALLLFFSIVTLRAARKELDAHPDSKLHQRVYLGNWVAIFALGAGAAAVWIMLNVRQQPVIRGEIRTFQGSEVIAAEMDGVFEHHQIIDQSGHFKVIWLFMSDRRLPAGTRIPFLFTDNAKENVKEVDLELEVKDSFYTAPVNVIYHRQDGKFFLEHLGKQTELSPAKEAGTVGALHHWKWPFAAQSVFAQEKVDARAMEAQLQSIDPVMRRAARLQLGKTGRDALPFIDQTLSNPNSSYQLQLGALSALNSMADAPLVSLSPSTLAYILRKVYTNDDTLRNEARKFLSSRASWDMQSKIDQARIALTKQHNLSAADRKQLADLSVAEMELLYNLGVREKENYFKGQKQSLSKAAGAFDQGWGLRQTADASTRINFAKCLYGWAVMLAERAASELDAHKNKRPELVHDAQSKFQDFLTAVQGQSAYPYPSPEHVKVATDYIANPVLRTTASLR